MTKKFTGFHRKLRIWRDEIFGAGFEAGAKARVAAGIPLPTSEMPKRSARVPTAYPDRHSKVLWAFGWKAGYAFCMTSSRAGTKRVRQRSLRWKRDLRTRGPLQISRANLVGPWRATRGEYIKMWNLAHDGSLTGLIVKGTTVLGDASGTWKVDGDCLVLDYKSYIYDGEEGAPYQDTSVILKITRNHLVIATGERSREKYTYVPQKLTRTP